MQADQTANPAALDPGRLRRITRSFSALQNGGLNTFLFGLWIVLLDISHLFPGLVKLPLTLLGLGCFILMSRYVPKYYDRRFGHIEIVSTLSNRTVVIFVVVIVASMFVGATIEARADAFLASISSQLHAAISDPEHRVNLSPVLFLIGASLTYALRSLLGLFQGTQSGERRTPTIELRVGYLALIICSAAALYPLHNPGITRFLLWKVLAFGWLGITLMAEGIYEHLTLIQLFPKRPDYDTDPS